MINNNYNNIKFEENKNDLLEEINSISNNKQSNNFNVLANIIKRYFDNSSKPKKRRNFSDSFDEFNFKYKAKAQLESLTNEISVKKMICSNPNVTMVLNTYNINLEVNTDNIRYNTGIHMGETANVALGIFNKMSEFYDFTSKDKEALIFGAMLHDFGKVLIPSEILNKKDKLTSEEKKVIEAHPELGYELLKNVIDNEKILEIIRSHHSYINGGGYPTNNLPSILAQIVTAADIYTALTEKRVYKERMSNENAIKFLETKVSEGVLDFKILECLKLSLQENIEETRKNVSLSTRKVAVA